MYLQHKHHSFPSLHCRPHYNVNLRSISVNGRPVPINPSVFATSSSNRGTIIDSGTTLVYLVDEAYNLFVGAVSLLVNIYHAFDNLSIQ